MRKKVINIMAAIIAVGLFGCTQQATKLDQNWGRSFESARYNQILNPEAGNNQVPVEGIEGPAAERIMEGHLSGNATEQKPSSEFGIVTIKR